MERVDVGGKGGERLRQQDAEAETACVRVEDVDAALNADGGRGSWGWAG